MSAYYRGAFYPVCSDNWSPVWSVGACRDLGDGAVLSMSTIRVQQSTYMTVVNRSVYNISQLTPTTNCESAAAVRLVCHQASCGLSTTAVRPYIIGGEIAAENAWPWAAVLLYRGSYQCTASVIGNGWLLTAAHCFFSQHTTQPLANVPHYFAVRLGTVLSRGYSPYLQVASVKSIVLHPDYKVHVDMSNQVRYHDVALVQLGDDLLTPLSTSSRVSPVCLADNQQYSIDTLKTWQCYVIGWGLSNVDGHISEYQSTSVYVRV